MSIQIFGTKKCRETAKAVRFFKERGIAVHFVDIAEKPLEHPLLLKTPVVRSGSNAAVGYAPEIWKSWLGK